MGFRSKAFKKVAIIGVGLMGGSLGLAIKKYGLAKEVIGISHRQSSLVSAIKNKAIDSGEVDLAKGLKGVDLVVLAAPVDAIVMLLGKINKYVKRGCIITDMGSVKVEIDEAARKNLSSPEFFVGSHPLAGSEKKGADFSTADLFQNSICVMTPTKKTNPVAKEKVKFLWSKIGATVKCVDAEKHDKILAYISHLPHLLTYGLMGAVPQEYLEYATRGFKDLTRIASSDPRVWNDICLTNSKNILRSVDEIVGELSTFRKAILNGDEKKIMAYFTKAKEKRDSIVREPKSK